MKKPSSLLPEKIIRTIQKFILSMLLILVLTPGTIKAQAYEGLVPLPGYKIAVYYSSGNDERAEMLATRCDGVLDYFKEFIGFEPSVTLLILDPEDWSTYTKFPVYGMPHYNDDKTLIVASQDNDFWKSFIPPVERLPGELASQVTKTYSDKDGTLTMQPFFDLLAIHELGHAYHFQYGLTMQRRWMSELFVNIMLHTYVAENEPELLPALTVFPKMVISGDKSGLVYTTLTDLENRYDEIGQKYPQNYGWYQCRWHAAAEGIYNSGGVELFTKLWHTLETQKEILDDSEFAVLLSDGVHRSVADVLLKWDQ